MLGAQAAHADKIDDAAKKLSEASYPFLKEIDWTSDVFAKVPTQNPAAVMKAIDKMIVMGAAMDSSALKAGGDAHHKAIGSMDGKLVTSLADYTAANAAIGHMLRPRVRPRPWTSTTPSLASTSAPTLAPT